MNQLKILHELLIKLKKVDNNNQYFTYRVCSYFVRKMTQYIFITINEKPASIHNVVNSNDLGGKEKLTRLYGLMYINLDEYPPYSETLSNIFVTK